MEDDCCGTYETSREKEIGKGAQDDRSLARRLLKSPEPSLPNYFSSVKAEPRADEGESEMLFDSKRDSSAESAVDTDKLEYKASPFKQFSKEANVLQKQKMVKDAPNANPIVNLEVSKDLVDDHKQRTNIEEEIQEAQKKQVILKDQQSDQGRPVLNQNEV